jgi:hypothetical protein
MTTDPDDERRLDELLDGPWLQVPDDFAARVLDALPARADDAAAPPPRRAWRTLQALLLAACGTCGAVEVLLFACSLWTATTLAVG